MTTQSTIAQRLRQLRDGRTQQQMAERMGVSQASYSQWETDRRHKNLDTFAEMCRRLNVSADWLLGLTDERKSLRIGSEISELRKKADAAVATIDEVRRRLRALETTNGN